MMYVNDRAAGKLSEELVQKCLESGLGFRLIVNRDDAGKITSAMKFDRQRRDDEVFDMDGVMVFSDAASAAAIRDFRLDYETVPNGGFFLKKVVRHQADIHTS